MSVSQNLGWGAADVAERVDLLEARLRDQGLERIDAVAVLGSGLGAFGERLEQPRSVEYSDLGLLPESTVPGHAGRFVWGRVGDAQVLLQSGRVHLYEGHSAQAVTLALRALCRWSPKVVCLTNAAGGLNEAWDPGTLMHIRDHLALQGAAPLLPGERGSAEVWDAELGEVLHQAADERGIPLQSGVYAGLRGPTYETPAEVRSLGRFGADAVGMSTVAEACVARALGARVVGISCITNRAAGLSPSPLSHDEVIEAGRAVAAQFVELLETALPRWVALA